MSGLPCNCPMDPDLSLLTLSNIMTDSALYNALNTVLGKTEIQTSHINSLYKEMEYEN